MNWSYHHAEFEELCALAQTGTLTARERLKLSRHLSTCPDCRHACEDYRFLALHGMPRLASIYGHPDAAGEWESGPAQKALFRRIQSATNTWGKSAPVATRDVVRLWSLTLSAWVRSLAAASLLVAVAYGAYRVGSTWPAARPAIALSAAGVVRPGPGNRAPDQLVASQAVRIAFLEGESSKKQREIDDLRSAQKALAGRSKELTRTSEESERQLRSQESQRSALAAQLVQSQQEYADAQKQLGDIKNERDKALLRVAALDTNVGELQAAAQDQERRLKDDERFLAADRDIRELMGARKLYIADVFDVDSGSRTRKPFGRVFYTENKSLIFYAFDLDRQPGIKNATFQAWGERDTALGEKSRPLNLGILYMDSESNRRWVLRFDDPKQLAEIDAVFVTVEPHGGSPKPTSKPFLYALLRKVANHP
jgi:TolA-binding protein